MDAQPNVVNCSIGCQCINCKNIAHLPEHKDAEESDSDESTYDSDQELMERVFGQKDHSDIYSENEEENLE